MYDFLEKIRMTNSIYSMTKVLFLVLFFIGFSCQSQTNKSKGYDNLDTLYSDFVRYVKIGGNDLKNYCSKITPDLGTVDYMEKNNTSYRGIPNELKKQNINISQIGEKYYENVARFRERLLRNNQLDSIIYIGREREGEELFDKKLGVYATETFIIMKSGNDTIRCKLGEMFNFGGKWKSFTSPKLGW